MFDNLQTGSWRGINFLLESSSVVFGQKTSTHNFPNSDRTEVDQFGKVRDGLNLTFVLYAQGDAYYRKRNAMKSALNLETEGELVHPFEGTKVCKVVGQVRMDETMQELGVVRFTATFQEINKKIYPKVTEDRSNEIAYNLDEINTSLRTMFIDNYNVDGSSNAVLQSALDSIDKVNEVSRNISAGFNLVASKANTLATNISNLDRYKPTLVQDAENLVNSIESVYTSLIFLTSDTKDNINMYNSMIGEYKEYKALDELSKDRQEQNKNTQAFIGLFCGTLFGYLCLASESSEYSTESELNTTKNIIFDNYNFIKDFIDFDTSSLIETLINNTYDILDNKQVNKIKTIDIVPQPLDVLCYSIYGNLDYFDTIISLNQLEKPYLVSGEVQIIDTTN